MYDQGKRSVIVSNFATEVVGRFESPKASGFIFNVETTNKKSW